jgi:hypothetical protein
MYASMTKIENDRCKSDKIYRCIVDTESSDLSEICSIILSHLEKEYMGEMSPRLRRTLAETIKTNDRVAKHALLFFALNEEKDLQKIFLSDPNPSVPPKKFTVFINKELPALCEKLLNGSFTSLRSFTEDCRWIYTTL